LGVLYFIIIIIIIVVVTIIIDIDVFVIHIIQNAFVTVVAVFATLIDSAFSVMLFFSWSAFNFASAKMVEFGSLTV